MGEELKTYFDFAEDDYRYLANDYADGRVANYMGAASQNTCERYLKYIVEECFCPETQTDIDKKKDILKTHSLRKLMKFLQSENLTDFSRQEYSMISTIDGFYFTTRYPGEDSFSVDKQDLDNCMDALNICRTKALDLQMELLNSTQRENEDYDRD